MQRTFSSGERRKRLLGKPLCPRDIRRKEDAQTRHVLPEDVALTKRVQNS